MDVHSGNSMTTMIFYAILSLVFQIVVSDNTCFVEQTDCRYKITVQPTDCLSNDQPSLRSNSIIEKTRKEEEFDDYRKGLKRLISLEENLTKMMEMMNHRSMRHIRHIRSELKYVSETVNKIAKGKRIESRNRRERDQDECPPEFLGGGSWPHCYRLATFNATWHEAKEYCSAIGADLVSLETVKEAYIVDYLLNSNRAYTKTEDWWTSASYIVRGHRWMWTAGRQLRPMDYTRWSPGEPNGRSTMHCMTLSRPDGYRWRDAVCSDKKAFICEVEL